MLCDSLYYTLSCWKEVLKISCMCFLYVAVNFELILTYLHKNLNSNLKKCFWSERWRERERERERERKRKREIERLVAINTEERLRG